MTTTQVKGGRIAVDVTGDELAVRELQEAIGRAVSAWRAQQTITNPTYGATTYAVDWRF